jgi:hypothetical protein
VDCRKQWHADDANQSQDEEDQQKSSERITGLKRSRLLIPSSCDPVDLFDCLILSILFFIRVIRVPLLVSFGALPCKSTSTRTWVKAQASMPS